MAYEEAGVPRTYEANIDLRTKQYRWMKGVDSGTNGKMQVTTCTAAGEDAIGILQNKPEAAGDAATIWVGGTSKSIAGDTIAAGAKVQTDANGASITAASGDVALAYARADAVAGDIFPVEILSHHILA